MSEREFTTQVLQLAALHGWLTLHLRPARTRHGWRTAVQGSGAGFPDILAVKGQRLVVAELKVGKALPTVLQEQWLAAWRHCGAEVHVWRPECWTEIVACFSGESL